MDRPSFIPFSKEKAIRIYQRNLPHWRQAGATYFVTFRLGDSIPTSVVREWHYEQQMWLKTRGILCDTRGGRWFDVLRQLPDDQARLFQKHFGRKLQKYLDQGFGACYLRDERCIEIVRNELMRRDGIEHHLGDVVIMPNHVHLLTIPVDGFELEKVLGKIKGASSRACNQILERRGKFWQADSYDHIVRSLGQMQVFRDYIASNPSEARISVPSQALYQAAWMDTWFAG